MFEPHKFRGLHRRHFLSKLRANISTTEPSVSVLLPIYVPRDLCPEMTKIFNEKDGKLNAIFNVQSAIT